MRCAEKEIPLVAMDGAKLQLNRGFPRVPRGMLRIGLENENDMRQVRLPTILMMLLPWLNLPQVLRAAEPQTLPHPEVARIEPRELKGLIDEKAPVIIVDTRDSLSYETSHIPGAINIYYDPNGDPVTREMMLVALPMDKLVVLYCP